MVWIDRPTSPRVTSALAHAAGGILVGWALATTLIRRGYPGWPRTALIGVIALTLIWELGEVIGDLVLDTALVQDGSDSAVDILLGSLGGAAGVAAARLTSGLEPDLKAVTRPSRP